MANLEQALGQYILYYDILQRLEPERKLYLAIREETFSDIFEEPIGGILLENKRLNLIVFDSVKEAIVRWIP
ncbi:XisH protein [Coleofasciculus chthonoplastes PCC 7420]|uniref:XisH protein n=1 Tax=Coleofasciculus chthonoplastes PCC 7420 TaxID=118168 RepID=B4W2P8_9CYAN|nr:XisH protein [Coleofasciculus chthonoplastes PCC 7420]